MKSHTKNILIYVTHCLYVFSLNISYINSKRSWHVFLKRNDFLKNFEKKFEKGQKNCCRGGAFLTLFDIFFGFMLNTPDMSQNGSNSDSRVGIYIIEHLFMI